ncbi:MAG: sigma-70 family RNA polymerase sigma factor [Rhodospirillaceae bacterium]|nr:sigma-70 family RNA polymerase sigma factor [Rhodospirillaceae bacterium]
MSQASLSQTFQDILLAHLPRLRAYAIMLTRDRALAEDLLQETALRALRAQSQFTMGTNFTAWIYKILRNEYIGALRRKKRQPVPIEDMPPELLSRNGGQETDVLLHEIIQAMDQLPHGQREVLILICASGLSYEEAADALGCSVGTIKSRLWRARARMASLILGEGDVKGGGSDTAPAPRRAAAEGVP